MRSCENWSEDFSSLFFCPKIFSKKLQKGVDNIQLRVYSVDKIRNQPTEVTLNKSKTATDNLVS